MQTTALPRIARCATYQSSGRRLRLLPFAFIVLGVVWTGCGERESEDALRHQRLFDTPQTSSAVPQKSYATVATLFDAGEDWLDSFSLRRVSDRYSIADGVFVFQPSGRKPQLVLPVPRELTGIQAFEIVARIPDTVKLQLRYTSNPPRYDLFDPDKIQVEPLDGGYSRWVFDLDRAGVLREDTDYLQLRMRAGRGASVALRSIRALRYSDETLEELASAMGQATLDDDTRPAHLAGVPSTLSREVRLPSDPYLSASLGVPKAFQELMPEVEATISLTDERGDRVELYSANLSPATDRSDRLWKEILLPLTEWASQRVTLDFDLRPVDGGAEGAPTYAAWSSPTVFQADRRTPSVVVFLEDTLRADKIHAYGNPKAISPERDAFYRQATVFDRAYSTSSWTLPAHASLFTSLRPLEHGVDTSSYSLGGDAITLAETYRLAGYATMAITDDGYLSPKFGMNRGFDRFSELKLSLATTDDRVARLEHFLDTVGPRPFFLFFHHYQTHEWKKAYSQFARNVLSGDAARGRFPARLLQDEFYHTNAYRNLPHEERRAFCNSLYDAAVAVSDRIFGRVMDLLEAKAEGRHQIQVMMSDHGEMLEDLPGMIGHGRYHHEPAIRIPLMIRLSWENEHRVIDEPVQLNDLYPTLLDLSRLEPVTEMKGRSLAPAVLRGEAPPPSRDLFVETNKDGVKITSLVKRDSKYNYSTTVKAPDRGPKNLRSSAGQEELVRLGGEGDEDIRPGGDPDAEPFRRAVSGYLQSVDGRIVVRVSNRGREPRTLTGRFELTAPVRDPHVTRGLIRDWSLEQGDFLTAEKGSNEVELELTVEAGDVDYLFVIHPEEQVRLHLFDEQGRPLAPEAVALGPDGTAPSSLPIDLSSSADELARSETEPEQQDGFSVRIWKTAGFVPFSVEASQLDEERVERLKALGYLQ
jgi:arylsulfatase A-like enzyme